MNNSYCSTVLFSLLVFLLLSPISCSNNRICDFSQIISQLPLICSCAYRDINNEVNIGPSLNIDSVSQLNQLSNLFQMNQLTLKNMFEGKKRLTMSQIVAILEWQCFQNRMPFRVLDDLGEFRRIGECFLKTALISVRIVFELYLQTITAFEVISCLNPNNTIKEQLESLKNAFPEFVDEIQLCDPLPLIVNCYSYKIWSNIKSNIQCISTFAKEEKPNLFECNYTAVELSLQCYKEEVRKWLEKLFKQCGTNFCLEYFECLFGEGYDSGESTFMATLIDKMKESQEQCVAQRVHEDCKNTYLKSIT